MSSGNFFLHINIIISSYRFSCYTAVNMMTFYTFTTQATQVSIQWWIAWMRTIDSDISIWAFYTKMKKVNDKQAFAYGIRHHIIMFTFVFTFHNIDI